MSELVGSIFIFLGSVFLFSAGLGLLRMPDAFTRIQTGTKATTMGATLVMIGLAIYHPDWIFKLLLIIYFVYVSNPISSHALARSGYRHDTPMTPGPDALAERNKRAAETSETT